MESDSSRQPLAVMSIPLARTLLIPGSAVMLSVERSIPLTSTWRPLRSTLRVTRSLSA